MIAVSKKTRSIRSIAFLACTGLLCGMLSASLPARADDGEVAVGGEHILTIRVGVPGMSIKDRADAVTERLITILGDPGLRASDIKAATSGKDAKILVKDRLLVTVLVVDAKMNKTTPLALAKTWVTILQRVLPRINQRPLPNQHSQ